MKQFVFVLGFLSIVLLVSHPASAMQAEQKTVTNGVVSIEYSVRGEGPLLLVIASTGRGTAEFAPLADRLAMRGYRVALPEPRGISGSTGPMENVTFHDFADDFAAVAAAEGGKAIVVGHAYGHWIAKTIASDYPEMTRGIVLLAGAAKSWPSELSDAITVISDPKSTREERLAGLKLAFFAEGNDPTPWLEGWHSDVIKSQSAARELTNRQDWWAGGTVPILDLQAKSDPFRPETSRMEAKDEFGNRVTIAVIEGASHALPAEKPIETGDVIADWANKLK
ncbi:MULTISPECIES: alpha/beta fold hydrolase [Photorhabdus]|uniref:alpha/beta fold hydrolase n=1 Tax=Photorhabdus TaxID=29487 RepID=UPI000DCBF31C|nr:MULTISPECIES: alpha/beta hydrolase [Photorhabdus]MCT8341789.1 alpha/beta hydrolase [Photorhabdus kleinii]RAX03667.1 alpha/beta hydrolase [Photorhabdus sp. S9-53]RAX03981.1 alpha/beta hydrolase [Photorhabdus sp. S10-54]RAX06017.1 alpha/beta hydrolase [Photorhabdus sp. S8-52]